jgi:hypothetical protein
VVKWAAMRPQWLSACQGSNPCFRIGFERAHGAELPGDFNFYKIEVIVASDYRVILSFNIFIKIFFKEIEW